MNKSNNIFFRKVLGNIFGLVLHDIEHEGNEVEQNLPVCRADRKCPCVVGGAIPLNSPWYVPCASPCPVLSSANVKQQ